MPSALPTMSELNQVFDFNCFKFLNLKQVIVTILENLGDLNNKYDSLNNRFNGLDIPDTSKIMLLISELEKKQLQLEKGHRAHVTDYEEFKKQTIAKLRELNDTTAELAEEDSRLEERIKVCEFEIEELKKRPIGRIGGDTPKLDFDQFVNIDDFNDLLKRMKQQEIRNEEQDLRLTNYEIRISKLEQMINDPLEQIAELRRLIQQLQLQMNNKVNNVDLYNLLMKKADVNDLEALKASLIRLNEIISDFPNQFADRIDNDKAHKMLQKNLKNLYDLFLSMKGEGEVDDPMFTTKHLHCASCAKGVHNMIGFRADHYTWNNFPFKDPNQRMAKMGQGFSKQYNQSQY